MPGSLRSAVFFDKDGTLIENIPYNVDCDRICLMPGAIEAAALLHRAGYRIVVVTNQAGVALGYFPLEAVPAVARTLWGIFDAAGVPLAGFYFCPHHPRGSVEAYSGPCTCRKPQPGMLLRAARELHIDIGRSWMIGDILDDVEAGNRAGCRSVLFDHGGENVWQAGPLREPHVKFTDLVAAAEYISQSGKAQGRLRHASRRTSHV